MCLLLCFLQQWNEHESYQEHKKWLSACLGAGNHGNSNYMGNKSDTAFVLGLLFIVVILFYTQVMNCLRTDAFKHSLILGKIETFEAVCIHSPPCSSTMTTLVVLCEIEDQLRHNATVLATASMACALCFSFNQVGISA